MKYIERETPRESETITSKYIDNKTDECGRQTETNIGTNIETKKCSGGGQVVNVLAFYSVDPSSNPAEVNNFNSLNCFINKKRPGLAHFFKKKH